MQHISSHFSASITYQDSVFEIYGGFTALPSELKALGDFPYNAIDVNFHIVENTDGFQDLPRNFHLFIKEDNGTYTSGVFVNQRFDLRSGNIISVVQSAVIEAYQDAIERKAEIEKQKDQNLGVLLKYFK